MALVLYVAPHQDDESLSMGASMRRHLEVGHDVHVLLVTYGANSAVRTKLGMARDEFVALRDDEYRRACRRVGIRPGNIHIADNRLEDGTVTADAAQAVIGDWVGQHPATWLKSYSNLGPTAGSSARHPDHVAIGQAAVNLLADGAVDNLRCYVEPWLLTAFKGANPGLSIGTDTAAIPGHVVAALDEYRFLDVDGWKRAIGYQSVADQINLVKANPVSYYHLPA